MQAEKTAFIFPGQGSQSVGMGALLAADFAEAAEIFAQANDVLGFDLARLAWEGPEESLNDTLNTQPALLTHSAAVWSVFTRRYPDFRPAFVAGHSMGQLSALFACGALPWQDALRLARRRGELMQQAGVRSPGGMAAIMGLDIPTLDELCARASQPGEIVQVANDNCPGQVVISGAAPALQRALVLAQEAKARKVTPLAVSIAAHSPLMKHAQAAFNEAVAAAPFQQPSLPLVGNVSAAPLHTAAEIQADLQAQLTSRVRWTESIQAMIAAGVDTFIEMGSGSVLAGLLKRIDREARAISLGKPEDFEKLSSL